MKDEGRQKTEHEDGGWFHSSFILRSFFGRPRTVNLETTGATSTVPPEAWIAVDKVAVIVAPAGRADVGVNVAVFVPAMYATDPAIVFEPWVKVNDDATSRRTSGGASVRA